MAHTAEFKSQTYMSVVMCACILKLSVYYYIIRHLHVYCISVRCLRHISSTPTSYLESPWFESWHTVHVLTEIFYGFPQCLKGNARLLLEIS